MSIVALLLVWLLLLVGDSDAAIINAATANIFDVAAAISQAQNGDTVMVPAGNVAWTGPGLVINKQINLIGAGPDVTQVHTTIHDNTDHVAGPMISWTLPSGVSRLSGFHISGEVADSSGGTINLFGSGGVIRVDNNSLQPHFTDMFRVFGLGGSVFDHNTFDMSAGLTMHAIQIQSADGTGDIDWSQPSTLGGPQPLFIETNVFTNDQSVSGINFTIDSFGGGRQVVRYNTFQNCQVGVHGTDTGGRDRSSREFEYYNNTFSLANFAFPSFIGIRGGTGVIHDNTATTTGTGGITTDFSDAQYFRAWERDRQFPVFAFAGQQPITSITSSGGSSTALATVPIGQGFGHGLLVNDAFHTYHVVISGATPLAYNGLHNVQVLSVTQFQFSIPAGLADASGTLTFVQPWDGNQDANGYPGIDQIGRGQGDLLSNDDPTPVGWPHQALNPMFIWGNTINGNPAGFTPDFRSAPIIVSTRDYFNRAPQAGDWLFPYTPYTYPHPLSGGTVTPPGSPTNLAVH